MLPSLRTFFGIIVAAGLAAATFWLFYSNSEPSSNLNSPSDFLNSQVCWAIRVNNASELKLKEAKHPALTKALEQSEWINQAVSELCKDSISIPFVIFKHAWDSPHPVLAIGAPQQANTSQTLSFIEDRLKTRATQQEQSYVFEGLNQLQMQFHQGCIFLAEEFDFNIQSLKKEPLTSRIPAWSADADVNVFCSSGSIFLTNNPNYNLNHPLSGDVYFRNESLELHAIAFPQNAEHSLYGKRATSEIQLEQFLPQNCTKVNIDHFGSAESIRTNRIAAINSQGDLAEWNRKQAQLENKLGLVLDEVTFEWCDGSAATFEWGKARNVQFLILTQSDSIAFTEAIVQLPGIELIEDNKQLYLKWNNEQMWANSMPFPYNREVNCATLRGNAVVMSSNIEALQHYTRVMNRQKTVLNFTNYDQKIETTMQDLSFAKNDIGAFFKSLIDSSTYPNTHITFYHGEDQRNFIHLSAGATEQIEYGPSVEWELALDQNIQSSPYWIRNHSNSEYYAVWQDSQNTIHAADANGREIWQIPLDESILGAIHQIDLYRNNKFQFIFATPSALHCYDRLGKKVDGYPYSFTATASSNLGVFDYDRNKNYRFVIGLEDGTVLNIKDEGVATKGWKAAKQSSSIAKVKHLRAGSKDYIFTLNKEGKIQLLKRNGETRIQTNASLPESSTDLEFLMKSSIEKSSVFVIDSAKRVLQINFNDGQMGEMTGIGNGTDLLLSDIDGDLISDLILVNGSTIEAYNSARQRIFKTKLDAEISGKPKVYNLEDGLCIGVLLGSQNKVVFLKTDGTILDEEGLHGSSLPVIKDADKDKHLEVLMIDDKRNIVCYEF